MVVETSASSFPFVKPNQPISRALNTAAATMLGLNSHLVGGGQFQQMLPSLHAANMNAAAAAAAAAACNIQQISGMSMSSNNNLASTSVSGNSTAQIPPLSMWPLIWNHLTSLLPQLSIAKMDPMAQIFCLRWNNHRNNLVSVFDHLLQTEAFCDVTLACDGASIKCHKMILSACSRYFQSLFMENSCEHPIVFLKDIKYSEIRAILDYMYKGEVNVAQDELPGLLKVAELLRVKGLVEEEREKVHHHHRDGHHSPLSSTSSSSLSTASNGNVNSSKLASVLEGERVIPNTGGSSLSTSSLSSSTNLPSTPSPFSSLSSSNLTTPQGKGNVTVNGYNSQSRNISISNPSHSQFPMWPLTQGLFHKSSSGMFTGGKIGGGNHDLSHVEMNRERSVSPPTSVQQAPPPLPASSQINCFKRRKNISGSIIKENNNIGISPLPLLIPRDDMNSPKHSSLVHPIDIKRRDDDRNCNGSSNNIEMRNKSETPEDDEGLSPTAMLAAGLDKNGGGIASYVPNQRLEWKRYKQYTRNDIMAAIEEVKKGMSALQASRKFGVPSRTLYDKVKKMGITTGRQLQRKSIPAYGASFPMPSMIGMSDGVYKEVSDQMKDQDDSIEIGDQEELDYSNGNISISSAFPTLHMLNLMEKMKGDAERNCNQQNEYDRRSISPMNLTTMLSRVGSGDSALDVVVRSHSPCSVGEGELSGDNGQSEGALSGGGGGAVSLDVRSQILADYRRHQEAALLVSAASAAREEDSGIPTSPPSSTSVGESESPRQPSPPPVRDDNVLPPRKRKVSPEHRYLLMNHHPNKLLLRTHNNGNGGEEEEDPVQESVCGSSSLIIKEENSPGSTTTNTTLECRQ